MIRFDSIQTELSYVSSAMKNDKEAVLAAVTQNGEALVFASDELKGDKDFILAAVMAQNGGELQFPSEELQVDKDKALELVTKWTEMDKTIVSTNGRIRCFRLQCNIIK